MPRYYYLTPMLGGPGAPRYPILEDQQFIGRSERVHIPLFEPTVSRQHASIQILQDEILLKDLGSKHGTFVNSRRVTSARLKVGDIVVFGLSLVLRLEESDKPVPLPDAIVPPQPREKQDDPSVTAIRAIRTPRLSKRQSHPTITFDTDLSHSEVDQIRSQKLAGLGAICLAILPNVQRWLNDLKKTTNSLAAKDMTEMQDGLGPLIMASEEILEKFSKITKAASAIRPPELLITSLFKVVQRAIQLATPESSARHVEILADVDPSLQVKIDPEPFVAALLEILRTAIRFSAEESIIEILAARSREVVILTISDQGTGLPQDLLDRLFDPYYPIESNHEHIGLGLFLAHQAILSIGGTMKITSKTKIGSTIRISLPFIET